MNYNVMDSIMCPLTGTVFTGVITDRNLKLIIWYQGETIVHSGDILSAVGKGLVINGAASDIAIITVFPFTPKSWISLSERTGCPANGALRPAVCSRQESCRFKHCPYGLEKKSKWPANNHFSGVGQR